MYQVIEENIDGCAAEIKYQGTVHPPEWCIGMQYHIFFIFQDEVIKIKTGEYKCDCCK
jgi:hypothetical protein